MSTFLGIGCGPIQTGIFLLGAYRGGFDRLVVADVDQDIVENIRFDGGSIDINIAGRDRVVQERIPRIEIFNPLKPEDLDKLTLMAGEADEIATALPGVNAYPKIIPWLKKGFEKDPLRRRFIYTAENHNRAAEILQEAAGGDFPNTFFLNTVIGKMSGIIPRSEYDKKGLLPLSASCNRGHLVEEFNNIFISTCPGIETRKTQGLQVRNNLLPFEEAKLYGHNAVHMLLGLLASKNRLEFMVELAGYPEIIERGRKAFLEESGKALCEKWQGVDELFTKEGFHDYAEDLLVRMVSPFLTDSVERVCRDLERKLGWEDRIVGTMRLVISQGFLPVEFSQGASLAVKKLFGEDQSKIRAGLEKLWLPLYSSWQEEHERILGMVLGSG